ncbi:MAG: hypothetical protein WAK17_12130 [Candidatus Nitrosopolaris sp.]|jgi:DNA polymerase I
MNRSINNLDIAIMILANGKQSNLSNSFIYNDSGLEGLYEIGRICRMPLHTAARASIGKCLSSLQFYYATKKGLLIPWKPTIAEHFKTYEQLRSA